ncbi:MAG: preprotein translocase subunit SecD [Gammaproteobacteria bacterium]|jgi:preprotein translocase subunit SecD
MLNQYPLWKYLIFVIVFGVGCFLALPNIFGETPTVQVTGERGVSINEDVLGRAAALLESKGLAPKRISLEDDQVIAQFADTDIQLKARDLLINELGKGYVIALNLTSAMPQWLATTGVRPMYLGLDLRGGVHFLLEVDMEAAVTQAQERYVSDLRSELRSEKIRYRSVSRQPNGDVVVSFRQADRRDAANDYVSSNMRDLTVSQETVGEEFLLRVRLDEQAQTDVQTFALQQNITTLRKRVDELGVAEPVIQQQGSRRIVVQLPGVQDPGEAREILGATATLEFRMVDDEHSVGDALAGRVPARSKLYKERNGTPVLLRRDVMLSGKSVIDASSGIEQQSGRPAVFVTLDDQGARRFRDQTKDKIGRPMAVVFIETKVDRESIDGVVKRTKRIVEDVISVATIQDQLGKNFQITGLDSTDDARVLALLLRAGALAAPIELIEERTVGPSLGKENIEQGFRSVIVGFVLVLVFMGLYYRVFGLAANVALAVNLVMIVAVLSMLQATLTLPGIAGIVLTVGMAVDANVLIFERIREEIRNGNTPQASIHMGYQKAFWTIFDANITTLIAAIVLFAFGTGPIKGFAITLSIGIVTSVITSMWGTRAIINLIYGGRRVNALSI